MRKWSRGEKIAAWGVFATVLVGLVAGLEKSGTGTRVTGNSNVSGNQVTGSGNVVGNNNQVYNTPVVPLDMTDKPALSLQASSAQGLDPGENVGGIVRAKGSNHIRLTIRDISNYPLQNMDLSISLPGTAALIGVGQAEDIQGVSCSFRNEGKDVEPDFDLHGDNGQWYDHRDLTKNINTPSLAWKVFCPVLPTDVPLSLVIAATPFKSDAGMKRIRIVGSYGITSGDGARQKQLDKTWNFD